MKEIIGVALSRFHDSEDQFEFLISYADGREIGHEVSRRAALAIHKELSENLDLQAITPPPQTHVEPEPGEHQEVLDALAAHNSGEEE